MINCLQKNTIEINFYVSRNVHLNSGPENIFRSEETGNTGFMYLQVPTVYVYTSEAQLWNNGEIFEAI